MQILTLSKKNIESAMLIFSPEVTTLKLNRSSDSEAALVHRHRIQKQHHGSVSSTHAHTRHIKKCRFLRTTKLGLWRGLAAGWLCLCGNLAWRWTAQFDHAAGKIKQQFRVKKNKTQHRFAESTRRIRWGLFNKCFL